MKSRLIYFLPPMSLILGFGLALLAAGVHSTFFIILPLLAFILGYLFSWRRGLLYSFLLFLSYTFATALMWEVRWAFTGIAQYLGAFITGGFSIVLVGALAPLTRRGMRNTGTIITLLILAGVVAWCSYLSIPRYRYSSGLNIMSLQNMELYFPTAVAADNLSEKLLQSSKAVTGSNPADWSRAELVETEYGKMWKLTMITHITGTPGLIEVSSNWYMRSDEFFSWPGRSPVKMLQFSPKFDLAILNKIEENNLAWPEFITRTKTLEKFYMPLKVKTDTETEFEIFLYHDVERVSGINFGYNKSDSYTERIEHYNGTTGDKWIMVPLEVISSVTIRGIGD